MEEGSKEYGRSGHEQMHAGAEEGLQQDAEGGW